MKKIGLIIIAVLSFTLSKAQTTIITDDSTYTPTSTNAIFEVHSSNNNKGILIPRLTTAQRTAITTSSANDVSLLVYDTDTNTFWYFNGTQWVEIIPGGTDDQLLTLSNDTLYIENGNWIYLGDYKELPSTAVTGQVLTWNGTAWVAQNSGSGADNWGTQVVESDATLSGNGTLTNPLTVNGTLTDDQNIENLGLSGTTLTVGIENGSSQTVDLSSLQDGTGTDDQNLTLSGNTLSIEDGNSVDLSTYLDNTDNQTLSISGNNLSISGGNTVTLPSSGDDWGSQTIVTDASLTGNGTSSSPLSVASSSSSAWDLTGNSGTVDGTNFIGTTDNIPLNFRVNNQKSGRIATDNTFFGYQSGYNATGTNNAIFGDGAGYYTTSGTENVFLGHHTGYYMQTGSSNTAIGYNAFYNYGGGGFGPYPGGSGNVAIGKWAMFNPISGDKNVAVGLSAFSLPNSGEDNVFIGAYADRDNNSNLSYSTAIGAYSNTDADYATAIGYRAYADNANTLILGQINGINGATSNTNVGIGTTNPTTMLEVAGEIKTSNDVNGMLTLGRCDNTNEGGQINFIGAGSNPTWYEDVCTTEFRIFNGSGTTTKVHMFDYNGGAVDLEINGQAYKPGGGSWVATSDRRSKENIKDYTKGLNEILKLHPVTYNYKKEFKLGDKTYAGLIAQEVEKVVPTMVETKDELYGIKNFKLVDPSELTYMLINAIKELKQENESLNQKLEQQQQQINKLLQQK